MRAAAQELGFKRLAAELGTTRVTLGSYFAGTAVAGTVLLLETRFREHESAKGNRPAVAP